MAIYDDPMFHNFNFLVEATAEEEKKYAEALTEFCELSTYARVYGNVYLSLVMGFYFRTGETPDLVRRIAQVWATGLAELAEN